MLFDYTIFIYSLMFLTFFRQCNSQIQVMQQKYNKNIQQKITYTISLQIKQYYSKEIEQQTVYFKSNLMTSSHSLKFHLQSQPININKPQANNCPNSLLNCSLYPEDKISLDSQSNNNKNSFSEIKSTENLIIMNSFSKGVMNINLMKYAHKRKTFYQKNLNIKGKNISNNQNNLNNKFQKQQYDNDNQYHSNINKSANVVNLQFNEGKTNLSSIKGMGSKKSSSKPYKDQKRYTTIDQVSKKIVNLYKENHKNKYQQLLRSSVDDFFKNTLQIGPFAKSILKENDMTDPLSRRKLINIERVAFPLRQTKTNFIRNKTSNSRVYKTSRQETSVSGLSKDQTVDNNHKRMKSFLDRNGVDFQQQVSYSDRPQSIQSKKKHKVLQSLIPIRKPNNRKDYFVFGLSDRTCTTENKIEMYRDLLWKVNYSNCLYVYTPENYVNNQNQSYKFYLGPGNNCNLIKGILKRRFWWTITNNKNQEGIHFIWTQLKINQFFRQQQSNSTPTFQKSSSNHESQTQQSVQQGSNSVIQPQFSQISKILSLQDMKIWRDHYKKNQKSQKTMQENTYKKRVKLYEKKPIIKIQDSNSLRIHNHLQFNFYIGNKKALFYNIKRFYELQNKNPFMIVPHTFHVKKGIEDPEWKLFIKYYEQLQMNKKVNKNFKNMWIVKPGENTNRGNGISVAYGLDDIKIRINGRERNKDGQLRTFILQKYIENPMLYQKRKFDIRHYALITCINGIFKFYWYQEGYIRTSSSEFNMRCTRDPLIHLTNDAIQKNTPDYGKYQKGNKLSYQDFQKYLELTYPNKKYNLFDQILPKMKLYATEAFKASYSILDEKRLGNNFELLGLDFMIDDNFEPWLIEINTNPCLQLSSPLLSRIIPHLIENVCRICIDPLFPPPEYWPANKKTFFSQDPLSENKFTIVFDQTVHGSEVEYIFKDQKKIDLNMGKIQQEDETYQDDGNEDWEEKKQVA